MLENTMKRRQKPEIPKHYSLHQTAEILGVSKDTVLKRVHQGYIKAVQFPGTHKWAIPEDDLLDYMAGARAIEPDELDDRDAGNNHGCENNEAC